MENQPQHHILPLNPPVNLHMAGEQAAFENNMPGIGTRELKMVVVYPAKKTVGKVNSCEKIKPKSKLYIKNMVSIRCKMVVRAVLENLSLHAVMVDLGFAEIMEDLSNETRKQLKTDLQSFGFELMDNTSAILIERTKNAIVEMIHYSDEQPKAKISVYLSEKLNYDYTYLSNLFSQVMSTTIEHYTIIHKIEKVKELLVYDELSLKEISYKLHYSSMAHLSNQFKKVTGLTPSHFKQLKSKQLIAL